MSAFYPDDLNEGHLECLYGVHLLIVLGAIPVFLWLMKSFHNKNFDSADATQPTDKDGVVTSESVSSGFSHKKERKHPSV